ncbi:histidine phosphatase family protein [Microvirga mediterraneensis]|uniref:Histidine phosphatase family protein n=1 Tax=Microvirga mediterraneensis TaxID=2754695 RepID=A0A838BKK5_9HYPH|nr:histidine phosphatase family protein [Microvirga mediterraneensis]MBA1155980.1 histidine phosphatase family protein [Microvirga mediterraneensis]
MRLILLRHGETVWNAERRLQGHADAPLSSRGIEQARRAAGFFAGGPAPGHIVSSDLSRARHTAELLGFSGFTTDERLREMDLGDWTGRWIEQIEASDPGAYRDWRLGAYTPPGGEGWEPFRGRVSAALDAAMDRAVDDVVIVAHEGVVRAACHVLVGLAPSQLSPISPAAITIFDVRPSMTHRNARLVAFNIAPSLDDLRMRGLDHAPV